MPAQDRVQAHPDSYLAELRNRNLDVPLVQYSVFITPQTEQASSDLEAQVALFFRIGPSSGIDYRVLEG